MREEKVKQLIKYFANVECWSICCPEDDSPILPGITSTCWSEIEVMKNSGLISSIQLILSKKKNKQHGPQHTIQTRNLQLDTDIYADFNFSYFPYSQIQAVQFPTVFRPLAHFSKVLHIIQML